MPMRGEIRAVAARPHAAACKAQAAWSSVIATISNPNLQCIAVFSAIGLLLAINVALHFPESAANFATLAPLG